MPTWLLVHPPLLGPAVLGPLADELRARGAAVAVPDLRGLVQDPASSAPSAAGWDRRWAAAVPRADVAVAFLNDRRQVVTVEPFLTGFVEKNDYVGRPVDVHVMKDGSLLVSDDHNGAIYRVTYVGSQAATTTPGR